MLCHNIGLCLGKIPRTSNVSLKYNTEPLSIVATTASHTQGHPCQYHPLFTFFSFDEFFSLVKLKTMMHQRTTSIYNFALAEIFQLKAILVVSFVAIFLVSFLWCKVCCSCWSCLLVCVYMVQVGMVQVASACTLSTRIHLEYRGIFSQIGIFSQYGIPKSQRNSNSSFSVI